MEMTQLFSVVIPSYNSSRTIGLCLKAVLSMDGNYEVIIVDDKSTDNSVSTVKRLMKSHKNLRLVELGRKAGAAGARNIGVKKAKGDIIMFTDADIICSKDTLTKAEGIISQNKDVAAFVAIFSPKLIHKDILSNYKHLYLCHYFIKQDDYITTLNTSLMFIRKGIFEKLGGFDQKLGVIGEDVELGTRIVGNGHKILLCRSLAMEHLKEYSLGNFVRDELTRARKMFRIFLNAKLEKKPKTASNTYKLKPISLYISLALTAMMAAMAIAYLVTGFKPAFYAVLMLIAGFIATNLSYWSYLKSQRGALFALKASFVTLFDMALMLLGMGLGLKDFIMRVK